MSAGHPLDAQGRVLPRCDWPADRHAPGSLEAVRRFCNTTNAESGADRLSTPDDFSRWLHEQGHEPFRASARGLERCIRIRTAIRRVTASHRDGETDLDATTELAELVGDVRFVAAATSSGFRPAVDPRQDPIAGFVGSMMLAIFEATSDATWQRLKSCRHCEWVVFDSSKNRSAQWCSMSACGGRAKIRRHRARLRAAADGLD